MKGWSCAAVVLAVLVVAIGADEVKKPKGAFSKVRVGQQVTLKQEASGVIISFFDDDKVPLTHKVIEIGNDFIVVEDIAASRETTIPIYSLKSIEKVKTKGL